MDFRERTQRVHFLEHRHIKNEFTVDQLKKTLQVVRAIVSLPHADSLLISQVGLVWSVFWFDFGFGFGFGFGLVSFLLVYINATVLLCKHQKSPFNLFFPTPKFPRR